MTSTMQPLRNQFCSGQRLVAKSAGATRVNAPRNVQIQCRSMEAGMYPNACIKHSSPCRIIVDSPKFSDFNQ